MPFVHEKRKRIEVISRDNKGSRSTMEHAVDITEAEKKAIRNLGRSKRKRRLRNTETGIANLQEDIHDFESAHGLDTARRLRKALAKIKARANYIRQVNLEEDSQSKNTGTIGKPAVAEI